MSAFFFSLFMSKIAKNAVFALCCEISIAEVRPAPSPIKVPSILKNYDNIAKRCLVAVFFSVLTHIIVINTNINDNKGAPGPLTND